MDEAHSFADFLRAYGEKHPPALIRKPGEDIRTWQASFRSMLDGLRSSPPERITPTPSPEIIESVENEDHTRLTLRYAVTSQTAGLAHLLIPSDLTSGEEGPAIVCLHGHATYGMDSVCGVCGMEDEENVQRAYALHAVRSGFVVLAPAWWGWAGRDGHLGRVGSRDRCNVIQMAAAMYGLNVLDLHMQDAQAAIDVLADRPEVDASRIGCMGNSYGGRTAMWLSVFDERIRACSSSGAMNTFRERSLKLSSCGIQYLPGLLKYGDVPEVYSLIAPRPLQLQAGDTDALITPEDRDRMAQTVMDAYCDYGAEDALDYRRHPGGHLLVWDLAEPFFLRHLGCGSAL